MKNVVMSKKSASIKSVQSEPRFLLAIKIRWFMLSMLIFFGSLSVITNSSLYLKGSFIQLFIPGTIILMAILYNFALHYSWYNFPQLWTSRLTLFAITQFVLDILVVTSIIHYSGGVSSWFWVLYVFVTIESIFLLPELKNIIAVGAFTSFCYSSLIALEYSGILSVYKMTAGADVYKQPFYIITVWIWAHILNIAVAFVCLDTQKKKTQELMEGNIRDTLTESYNREYFDKTINNEVQRSKRFMQPVSVLLVDIDNFAKYKVQQSKAAANELLIRLANVLSGNIRRHRGEGAYDIDILCRYGEDKFALILPGTTTGEEITLKEIKPAGAVVLAKRLMGKIAEQITSETGVTVSIGIAGYPYNALETRHLIEALEGAVKKAKAEGAHRIIVAPPVRKIKKVAN